jgi:hypothetical protein
VVQKNDLWIGNGPGEIATISGMVVFTNSGTERPIRLVGIELTKLRPAGKRKGRRVSVAGQIPADDTVMTELLPGKTAIRLVHFVVDKSPDFVSPVRATVVVRDQFNKRHRCHLTFNPAPSTPPSSEDSKPSDPQGAAK